MKTIEQTFSDNEGNHLLVALYFYDNVFKQGALGLPEEFVNVEVADINITKKFVDRPIHYSAFFNMSLWLLHQLNLNKNAIFTFVCSTDSLDTNHPNIPPQEFRWKLFDKLYQRYGSQDDLCIQDIEVGSGEYKTFGRAFFHSNHSSLISITLDHINSLK